MKKSMEDLRSEIDRLSVIIGYGKEYNLNEGDEKFVWDLIDFGYHEDNVLEGKCSLQSTLDFDSEKWESKMVEDYEKLKEMVL